VGRLSVEVSSQGIITSRSPACCHHWSSHPFSIKSPPPSFLRSSRLLWRLVWPCAHRGLGMEPQPRHGNTGYSCGCPCPSLARRCPCPCSPKVQPSSFHLRASAAQARTLSSGVAAPCHCSHQQAVYMSLGRSV
jgi:hypothetical protein